MCTERLGVQDEGSRFEAQQGSGVARYYNVMSTECAQSDYGFNMFNKV